MPERKTTESQDRILAAIARAVAAERGVEAAARQEAEELVRNRVAKARHETNALMFAAVQDHGITKSAVAKRGLGNTNRNAVDLRLSEHAYRNGVYGTVPAPANVSAQGGDEGEQPGSALDVAWSGERGIVVTLDQFTHEDVGENMSGEVVFDSDGTVAEATGPMDSAVTNDPLLAMRLWGLEEVQGVAREH